MLEPNYHKFKQQLKTVKTIDDIMMHHSNFLDECLKQCLLTDQHLFRIITQINIRTLFFSRVIIRFFNNVKDEETLDRVKDPDEMVEPGADPYAEAMSKMDRRK